MAVNSNNERLSAFSDRSIDDVIEELIQRTQALYLEDEIPWVVGYSGGKDSTATVQLIWSAISRLPKEKQNKVVHIISTDTLVENPIVALWVKNSLSTMEKSIREQELPFEAHRLTPQVQNRFWVNLVGKGYPAPRPKFRWCTSRLKIEPSNKFIQEVVKQNGEAILVLGTRKAESIARKKQMERNENSSREYLSKNSDPSLDRVWVYTPISDWSNDDVWEYLVTFDNPWGYKNNNLLSMYRGATQDNECPLVVDSSTPSCGDSRFGCFVCTMVSQDKSMAAMIQNDDEKKWMKPLLELRNKNLDINDRHKRDFRKIDGTLMVYNGRLVHGPYKQGVREEFLEKILAAQLKLQKDGPKDVKDLELLSIEDLEEIRRIWVMEKHEIEDSLPRIYEKVMKKPYPVKNLDESQIFKPEDLSLLKEICQEEGDGEDIHYQLTRELLHLEQQYRTSARRKGLYETLDKALEKGAFNSSDEAESFAVARKQAKDGVKLDKDDDLVLTPEDIQLDLLGT